MQHAVERVREYALANPNLTVKELAIRLNVATSTVERTRRAYPELPMKIQKKVKTAEQILELYKAGKSVMDIAITLDICRAAIYYHARIMGLSFKERTVKQQ